MIPLTNHDSRLRSEVFKNHPPRTGKPTVGRNACALPVPSTISYPQKNEIPKEKPHRLSQNFSTNPIPLTEDTPEPPGFLLDLFITWGTVHMSSRPSTSKSSNFIRRCIFGKTCCSEIHGLFNRKCKAFL